MATSSRTLLPLGGLLVTLAALVSAGMAEAQRVVKERFVQSFDAPLAIGARVVVESLELDDGTEVTLEVSPIEVFAKGAEIVVHGKNGDHRIAPPFERWFSGRVAGDPSSLVVLARGRGLRGLIVTEGRVAWVSPEGGAYGDGPPGRTLVRSLSPETDMPEALRHFMCGTESLSLSPERETLAFPARETLSNVMYYAGIGIETDYELYAKFNSTTGLASYVGDLFAAISAIYQRDVLVTLQVNYLSIWTTSTDPWNAASDTLSALYEFGDYWHANRTGVPRVTAHMLSGKGLGGGIAWLSALCRSDFSYSGHWGGGYGFTASLSGTPPQNLTTTYWDFMAVAHEIGHNFSSPHTHCYSPPVDQCRSGETGCYSGQTDVPPENGTIMSYCHLLSGGFSNIKMFLGVPTESSNAVLTRIRTYVEGQASCFGIVAGPVVTAVSPPAGSTTGGAFVTISGSGFAAGATVKIGGIAATGVSVPNATTITATTPAHAAGSADVTVTNPGNQGFTLAGGYAYVAGPSVTSISPNSGGTAGGTAVTILGSGFQTGAGVTIGGVAASGVVVATANSISATTGAHATGTVAVTVTNLDLTAATLPGAFFYTPPPGSTRLYTLSPCRVVDTRGGAPVGGPALGPSAQRVLALSGLCDIPADASSISVNITVVPVAAGFMTLFPGNGLNPGSSSINFGAGQVRANNAVLRLSTDGTGTIAVVNGSAGSNHLVLDVNGFFR